MAKGGGGAWKVAYADFVTAMMAFFLVMWICSQDQKIKQAVARYFVTPIGLVETGSSTRPNHVGAIFSTMQGGSVPMADDVSLGRGRRSHSQPGDISSSSTRAVGHWLRASDKQGFWENEVQVVREYARTSKDLLDKPGSHDEIARLFLSKSLRDQVTRKVHAERGELADELLSQALSEVNWLELAEDLLAEQAAAEKPAAEKRATDKAASEKPAAEKPAAEKAG